MNDGARIRLAARFIFNRLHNYLFTFNGLVLKLLKTLITTSHRPTRSTRRFVKMLSQIVPDSIRVTRGKYTVNALLLQAVDLDVKNIIIIRNRSGNPGYIDLYSIDDAALKLNKICTIKVCGYKIIENYERDLTYDEIIFIGGKLIEISIDEHFLACILRCFNINIVSSMSLCRSRSILEAHIKMLNNAYELSFSNCKGEPKGLVLKICPTKTITQK